MWRSVRRRIELGIGLAVVWPPSADQLRGLLRSTLTSFVALGVIIRGETYQVEVVSNESARGITELTLAGAAVGNGILTVENEAQAVVRADPAQLDKGGGAAQAALAMMGLSERFS